MMTGISIDSTVRATKRTLSLCALIVPWLMLSSITAADERARCPEVCQIGMDEVLNSGGGAMLETCDTIAQAQHAFDATTVTISYGTEPDDPFFEVQNIPSPHSRGTYGYFGNCRYYIPPDDLIIRGLLSAADVWACIRAVNDTCKDLGF